MLLCTLVHVALFSRVFDKALYMHRTEKRTASAVQVQDLHMAEAPLTMLVPALVLAFTILLVGIFNQSIVAHVISFAVPGNF